MPHERWGGVDKAEEPRHNRRLHNNLPLLTRWTRMPAAPSGDWRVSSADLLRRSLGGVSARPSTLSDPLITMVWWARCSPVATPRRSGTWNTACLHCGQGKHVVAMSCKSSLVLCAGAKVAVDNWVSQVSRVLHEGVIYRHIILTVPAMFRTTFYQNAAVVLSAFYTLRGAMPRLFLIAPSRGRRSRGATSRCSTRMARNGQYHPHLHVLATSGGYEAQGARWEHLQYLPYDLLRRKWQWHLLRYGT